MVSVSDFCAFHGADPVECKVLSGFSSLSDAWVSVPPDVLIWMATRPGVLSDFDLRGFSLLCARSVLPFGDSFCAEAFSVTEAFISNRVSFSDLEVVHRKLYRRQLGLGWADQDYVFDVFVSLTMRSACVSALQVSRLVVDVLAGRYDSKFLRGKVKVRVLGRHAGWLRGFCPCFMSLGGAFFR